MGAKVGKEGKGLEAQRKMETVLCGVGGGEGAKRWGAEWSGKEAPTAEVQEPWAPPRVTFATME